jgi:hypothetical protein
VIATKWLKLLGTALISALGLTACQSGPTATSRVAAERDPRVSGVVVVREYEDEFKIDGHDVRVRVEYAWDYDRGVAIERITELSGRLMSQVDQPDLTLNLTEAEKQYAFELASSHPDLKQQMERADHVYGGFSYREANAAACYLHSRCVHVVASEGDGWRKLVHAIVDLQSASVVYPHYDDGKTTPFDPTELRAKGRTP